MHYIAPTTADLARLKTELGYTSTQMAELAGITGDRQWRKYTGGQAPREMNAAMLFMLAARLVLSSEDIERVTRQMRLIGASVEFGDFTQKHKKAVDNPG